MRIACPHSLVSDAPGGRFRRALFAAFPPGRAQAAATFGAVLLPAPMILPIAQAATPGLLGSPFLLVGVLFVVMYLTMIRPQARQAKAHRALVEGLQKNDRIVTQGGIHGTITRVDETTVVISVEDGTRIRVERSRVAAVIAKDAAKTAAVEVSAG